MRPRSVSVPFFFNSLCKHPPRPVHEGYRDSTWKRQSLRCRAPQGSKEYILFYFLEALGVGGRLFKL